ncbi:hypothetical protein VUR80DRAFT_3357 [Thermomyces stellatus]
MAELSGTRHILIAVVVVVVLGTRALTEEASSCDVMYPRRILWPPGLKDVAGGKDVRRCTRGINWPKFLRSWPESCAADLQVRWGGSLNNLAPKGKKASDQPRPTLCLPPLSLDLLTYVSSPLLFRSANYFDTRSQHIPVYSGLGLRAKLEANSHSYCGICHRS